MAAMVTKVTEVSGIIWRALNLQLKEVGGKRAIFAISSPTNGTVVY